MFTCWVVKRTEHFAELRANIHPVRARTEQMFSDWSKALNNTQHFEKQSKCWVIQQLFSEKFDRDQTSLNKTQQGWTRLNNVVKRSEHFALNKCSVLFSEMFSTFERGLILNILTEQHWTFVQQSWVLFSDVQLLGGQTYWTFCWTRLNFALTFTHCARANWINVQWLVKRTEQHSTFRKTKQMLSHSTFVQWKVWSRSNFTEQDSTRVNKAQQGGQTLWTFCTQQMFSVVQWNV